MSLPKAQAWFAAKKYGYGWSWPLRWQGWVATFLYAAVVLVAGLALARFHPRQFVACLIVSTALLVALCAWKGEAPKWRWGKSDDDRKS